MLRRAAGRLRFPKVGVYSLSGSAFAQILSQIHTGGTTEMVLTVGALGVGAVALQCGGEISSYFAEVGQRVADGVRTYKKIMLMVENSLACVDTSPT
jgi:hypothetical protein